MNYDSKLFNTFAAPGAILKLSRNGIETIDVNDRFLNEINLNVDKSLLIGHDPLSVFDEINRDLYVSAVKRTADEGRDVEIETKRIPKLGCCDEGMLYFRSIFSFIEKEGDTAYIFESIRNITKERNNLDSLIENERRFKIASEQINIYYWEYDIATKEMRPCFRCMRDLGLPALVRNYPEPAIEMGIIPADYADMYREWHRQIENGVKELEADIPLTVGRVPFRVKYTTEFDSAGKPVKAYGSATLISDTEKNNEKLNQSIIQTLAMEYSGIYLVDLEKDYLKVIKTDDYVGLEIFKEGSYLACAKRAIEMIRRDDPELFEGADDLECLRHSFFVGTNRRELTFKMSAVGKWIRVIYVAVEKKGEEVTKFIISYMAIDDLKGQKLDDERLIAKQKAALEEREKMLTKAVEEANRANAAKTAFFSNMSHDIRTPMNAIMGFSNLALEEIEDKGSVTLYLDKIVSSSEHLLNLINDILDMSRIESGKIEIYSKPENLKDIFTECYDLIRQQMENKGIHFNFDIAGIRNDYVLCDKLRLKQVVLNLLSNAYKFTPEKGSVDFRVYQTGTKDSNTYEIHVKDNGIGMSEEFKKHIFEPFTREKTEMVGEIQGTGLGMSIVSTMVELMNGTIELETEPNVGSEFIITLSLPACDGNRAKAEKEQKNEIKTYEGKTILLVDDTAVNRLLASRILQKKGFTVLEANNGLDAIDIVAKSRPGDIDVVLMDVMMPVMDGLEATKRIRNLENEELANIPIIAMTAKAFDEDIADTIKAGMNAHVAKPLTQDDLFTKLDRTLEEND